MIQKKDLDEIHTYIKSEFEKHEIPLLGIYVCTDHPEKATERRKPGPGMFLEAEMDHNLNLEKCLMIGDSVADIESGEMLGMDTMLVLTGRGLESMNFIPVYETPAFIVDDLSDGAKRLCP